MQRISHYLRLQPHGNDETDVKNNVMPSLLYESQHAHNEQTSSSTNLNLTIMRKEG